MLCIICIHAAWIRETGQRKRSWMPSYLSYLEFIYLKPSCKLESKKRKQKPLSNPNRCHQVQRTCIPTNTKTYNNVPKKLSYQVSLVTQLYKPQLIRVSEWPMLDQTNKRKKKQYRHLTERSWEHRSKTLKKSEKSQLMIRFLYKLKQRST